MSSDRAEFEYAVTRLIGPSWGLDSSGLASGATEVLNLGFLGTADLHLHGEAISRALSKGVCVTIDLPGVEDSRLELLHLMSEVSVWGSSLWGRKNDQADGLGFSHIITHGDDFWLDSQSSRLLPAHQDGASIAGRLAITGLVCLNAASDPGPATYVTSILAVARMFRDEYPALYPYLFRSGLVVVSDPRSGEVRYREPVLSLRNGFPLVFLRAGAERFGVSCGIRDDAYAIEAFELLQYTISTGWSGRACAFLSKPARAVIFNNLTSTHGREAFAINSGDPSRELAAFWWSLNRDDATYNWSGTSALRPPVKSVEHK